MSEIRGKISYATEYKIILYYMASFSRSRDLLEQWRAYGNFCIGFDAKKLNSKKGISLYKCLYRNADIKKWILKHEKSKIWDVLNRKDFKRFLAYMLIHIASMKFKNANFKNEKEVRLVAVSNHNWLYDNSPDMYENDLPIHTRPHLKYGFPVPFVKFYMENDKSEIASTEANEKEMEMKARKLREENSKDRSLLPITEVIIGPVAYQREARVACKFFWLKKAIRMFR